MPLKKFERGAFDRKAPHVHLEEILSLKRGGITTRVTLRENEVLISKCFNPEVYRNSNHEIYQKYCSAFSEGKSLSADSYPQFPPKYYFNKETYMLTQINAWGEGNFAPLLIGTCPSEDRLLLENIQGINCQQAVVSHKKKDLLEHMVNVAAEIHFRGNKNMGNLFGKRKQGILRIRSEDEEKQRLRHYLETIVYHRSYKFREFCEKGGIDLSKEVSKNNLKRLISSFAAPNLNNTALQVRYSDGLKGFVDWFITEKNALLYPGLDQESGRIKIKKAMASGSLSFVHGDLHPRNIFIAGQYGIKVCDFTHSRLGSRYTDLGTILYEPLFCPTTPDEEISTLESLSLYVEQVKAKEKINLNFQEVVRECLFSRLEESIRLYSIYCRYSERERKQFLPERLTNGMRELYRHTDSKDAFLDWTYHIKIGKLFSYFSQGEEGWQRVIGSALDTESGRRLHSILLGTQECLEALGIIEKTKAEEERDSRFQRIWTQNGLQDL